MLAISEDTQMLAQSALDLFLAQDYPGVIRAQRAMGAAATGFEPSHWQSAVDLGWTGIVIPDDLGGLGFPVQGLFGLFEAAGRSLSGLPLLSQLVLAPTLLQHAPDDWAPRSEAIEELLQGSALYGIAFDEGPRHSPTQCQTRARQTSSGWMLSGAKRYALDATHAKWILVTAHIEGAEGVAVFRLPANAPGLVMNPCALIDLRSRSHLELSEVSVGPEALVCSGDVHAPGMHRALMMGRACVAAELLGISQAVFDATLDYLQQREQFDRKLGSFQALQHRMARLHAEIQLAKAGVLGAFEALDGGEPSAVSLAVAMAKYKAGEVSDLATNEATQLHGGMGVTDELNLGLYLKRARVAERVLGDQSFQLTQLLDMQGALV